MENGDEYAPPGSQRRRCGSSRKNIARVFREANTGSRNPQRRDKNRFPQEQEENIRPQERGLKASRK